MKDKKTGHRQGGRSRSFEFHRVSGRDRSGRQGKAWRFFATDRFRGLSDAAHVRATARMAALPGKHVRSVREPVRAAHCKDG